MKKEYKTMGQILFIITYSLFIPFLCLVKLK